MAAQLGFAAFQVASIPDRFLNIPVDSQVFLRLPK